MPQKVKRSGLETLSGTRPGSSICIVTPDLMGPVKNGGIGTHVHWLSRAMTRYGHSVTILFSGEPAEEPRAHWVEYYAAFGVKLIFLGEVKQPDYPLGLDWEGAISYRIFHYLKSQTFDSIHFQDWKGTGFHCMMAKKAGVAFRTTPLTVTLHSSIHWVSDGMHYWPEHVMQDARIRYAEEFAASCADIVVSPSSYMVGWARQNGWALPDDVRVQFNCFDERPEVAPYKVEQGMFAFFGRLETRKGLALMIEAVLGLTEEQRTKINKIWFVGKPWFVHGKEAGDYLALKLAGTGLDWEIAGNLGAEDALTFIREKRALAICPSLSDNSPYTIVECCMRGIPVIAAQVGGVPELLDDASMFEPTPSALRAKLVSALDGGYVPGRHKYDAAKAADAWNGLVRELAARKDRRRPAAKPAPREVPGVSVCIPFFNAGKYLDDLLHGLAKQEYKNFEVVMVDDASTDPLTTAQRKRILKDSVRNIRLEQNDRNLGIGGTRNRAVASAKHGLLQFLDADNYPLPNMLSAFVDALQYSGADAATCFLSVFLEHQSPRDNIVPFETYMPLGPALNLGVLENVFGDANFMVKKAAWKAIGGFSERRGVGWEDWEFLARLSLKGHSQIVVPEMLAWYRKNSTGVLATTPRFPNQRFILDAYAANSPPWVSKILDGLVHPYHNSHRRNEDMDWAFRAVRENYEVELKFVSDVLSKTKLGRFIRRSPTTQNIIEKIFGPK